MPMRKADTQSRCVKLNRSQPMQARCKARDGTPFNKSGSRTGTAGSARLQKGIVLGTMFLKRFSNKKTMFPMAPWLRVRRLLGFWAKGPCRHEFESDGPVTSLPLCLGGSGFAGARGGEVSCAVVGAGCCWAFGLGAV